jgi:hypothetical protein
MARPDDDARRFEDSELVEHSDQGNSESPLNSAPDLAPQESMIVMAPTQWDGARAERPLVSQEFTGDPLH